MKVARPGVPRTGLRPRGGDPSLPRTGDGTKPGSGASILFGTTWPGWRGRRRARRCRWRCTRWRGRRCTRRCSRRSARRRRRRCTRRRRRRRARRRAWSRSRRRAGRWPRRRWRGLCQNKSGAEHGDGCKQFQRVFHSAKTPFQFGFPSCISSGRHSLSQMGAPSKELYGPFRPSGAQCSKLLDAEPTRICRSPLFPNS